jgi:hypothetical protein
VAALVNNVLDLYPRPAPSGPANPAAIAAADQLRPELGENLWGQDRA